MSRPLRIEFPGAVYHVTSRGDRQEAIFHNDDDRSLLLALFSQAMERLDAAALAYCLMGNHYHVVLRTRQANLSRLMRHINGEYTRSFNRRHGLTGHVFQGRFGAVLVECDAYMMEVCRYVELNPVRAGLCPDAGSWAWSSYRAHVGLARGPTWLATAELHGHLLRRDVATARDCSTAATLYANLVADGIGLDLWDQRLRGGMFLGNEGFASEMLARASAQRLASVEVVTPNPAEKATLGRWVDGSKSIDECYRLAYSRGGMTMAEIARQAGISQASVSRRIARAEAATCKT